MNHPVKPHVPGEYTSENTRPHTKCRRYFDRHYCNHRFDAHDPADGYRCPGAPEDKKFLKHAESKMVSQSFNEGEITVMEFIVATLLKGGDASMATRHKDFANVYRKVKIMKKRAKEKREAASESNGNGT